MLRGRLPAVLFAALALVIAWAADDATGFRHHSIHRESADDAKPIPGYGSPVLADFDRDSDLDFAALRRGREFAWWENQGADRWAMHKVGDLPSVQLGSIAIDVDRDGWIDIVVGGHWFRNPGKPAGRPFERFQYDDSIDTEIHDIAAADIDGDGNHDVAVLGDREGLFWYRIPKDPRAGAAWEKRTVTLDVLDAKDDIHGGIAPRGAGDLDGDGDADLALTDRWLENRNRGAEWVRHSLPFGKRGPWGLSSRSWIIDLDRDGDNDIVVTDCDQKDSRAAWLENDGGKPPSFKLHVVAAPPRSESRGSFHSLAVADFDGDGDADLMSVEQEDPSILPEGVAPRWFLWRNLDGKGGRFAEEVVFDGRLGGHDIQVGDVDGDGDPDVASKVWRRWPGNATSGRAHVDWLENVTRSRTPGRK